MDYKDQRDLLLEHLLILEATNIDQTCGRCNCQPGLICCRDCHHSPVFCDDCTLKTHLHLPFHKLDKWNGRFFQKSSLHALGYIMCLDHGGQACPHALPTPGFDTTVTMVHINGIFKHHILWCACPNASNSYLQLFKAGLFASSSKRPHTAFTFNVLDYYYIDSWSAKLQL